MQEDESVSVKSHVLNPPPLQRALFPRGLRRSITIHDGLSEIRALRAGQPRAPNTRGLELQLETRNMSVQEYNEVYCDFLPDTPSKLALPEAPFSDSDDDDDIAESKRRLQQDARGQKCAAPLMRKRCTNAPSSNSSSTEVSPEQQASIAATRQNSPLFLRAQGYSMSMWS